MKNVFNFSISGVIALFATVLFHTTVAAQYSTVGYSNSSTSSSAYLLSSIKTKMAMAGYSLASDDYFTIREGEVKIKNRSFYSSSDYVVIVLPTEDGVNDLDLYLCDSYGNAIVKDDDHSSTAMVRYSPYTERNAVIKVKNQDSNRLGYGYDAHLLIFYK